MNNTQTPEKFTLLRSPLQKGNAYALFIQPEIPFWFVANQKATKLLTACDGILNKDDLILKHKEIYGGSFTSAELNIERLFSSINIASYEQYQGKSAKKLSELKEIWLHLTDKCNLRCGHCLFSKNLSGSRSLSKDNLLQIFEESYNLGARLFCFTGGEPLMHSDFIDVISEILEKSDTNIAVLTNGILIGEYIEALTRLDIKRLHFQASLEGTKNIHEKIRGSGAFEKTIQGIRLLQKNNIPFSVSVAINHANINELNDFIEFIAEKNIKNLHFMWHFTRGNGEQLESGVKNNGIKLIIDAVKKAEKLGIQVDNIEALKSQVFSHIGTRFDFGNACFESLAIGPDGKVYPTPATVDLEGFSGGNISEGLENIWKNSKFFNDYRKLSVSALQPHKDDPLRFILGGGDLDHSITGYNSENGSFEIIKDPFYDIYEEMLYYAISKAISNINISEKYPSVALRMGDITTECPSGDSVNFTHCNCLLSIDSHDGSSLIGEFYAKRTKEPDKTILNPIKLSQEDSELIPADSQQRMYGCGSPVRDCQLKEGEALLDLGSGTGVECFIASKIVGKNGRVYGVDMLDPMLDIANKSKKSVENKLNYSNITFLKGFLEDIPVSDAAIDVVISNCVMNLCKNKRRAFSEIMRILRHGGRFVISDVVTENLPSLAIRADHTLSGECISGAFVQDYLFAMLHDIGFINLRIIKRFPYRNIQGHQFFSLTFEGVKPGINNNEKDIEKQIPIIYGGQFASIVTENGEILFKGRKTNIAGTSVIKEDKPINNNVYLLDNGGAFLNSTGESCCSCEVFEDKKQVAEANNTKNNEFHKSDCIICGSSLCYQTLNDLKTCSICKKEFHDSVICVKGHYICDSCHSSNPVDIIKNICLKTSKTDMITLMNEIREFDIFPIHGPEHHSLVPGVILAAFKNSDGNITDKHILTGIERGMKVPGGACAFLGACGAAMGVGIAFSIIFEATPLTPKKRQDVQDVVADVLREITKTRAPRCCQRECYVSLKKAASLSKEILGIELQFVDHLICSQYDKNRECIRKACALFPLENKVISD